jgi:hypothetical protein
VGGLVRRQSLSSPTKDNLLPLCHLTRMATASADGPPKWASASMPPASMS